MSYTPDPPRQPAPESDPFDSIRVAVTVDEDDPIVFLEIRQGGMTGGTVVISDFTPEEAAVLGNRLLVASEHALKNLRFAPAEVPDEPEIRSPHGGPTDGVSGDGGPVG